MPEDGDPGRADAKHTVTKDREGTVEAYRTEDGVVLYDAGNPLAWIESRAPVALDDAA